MDFLKEAFDKVKKDISFLNEEIFNIKEDMTDLRESMIEICNILKEVDKSSKTDVSKNPLYNMNLPTDNAIFKPLNHQNQRISIGNTGVPTDRQTNQQTDRQTNFKDNFYKKDSSEELSTSFENAIEILNSLDSLKKELRLKFKRLTEREFLVFSTLYQLTDEKGHSDYRALSKKLNLTESSIRDYIGKLINKGIPVDKIKINNKNIILSISPNLKKIASLSTILQLREI